MFGHPKIEERCRVTTRSSSVNYRPCHGAKPCGPKQFWRDKKATEQWAHCHAEFFHLLMGSWMVPGVGKSRWMLGEWVNDRTYFDKLVGGLVVWNIFEHFSHHIETVIIATDFRSIIFQRGSEVNHQPPPTTGISMKFGGSPQESFVTLLTLLNWVGLQL